MQIEGACPCIARRRGSRELPVAAAIGLKWGSARSREGSAVERGGGHGWIERTTVGMRERREIPEDEGEKG
jgi:hypothetical protein